MINKLKQLWYGTLLWWEQRKISKEQKKLEEEILSYFHYDSNISSYVEDDVQRKYNEGINVVKRKINNIIPERSAAGYEKTLGNIDLLELAKEETEDQRKLRELRESSIVAKGQDIKDETDKEKMIDRRIDDYYKLQKYNEERSLLKKIKQAIEEGNKQLAEELDNERKQKFNANLH